MSGKPGRSGRPPLPPGVKGKYTIGPKALAYYDLMRRRGAERRVQRLAAQLAKAVQEVGS